MNLGIRGIEADLGNYADTFSADQHKNEKFDYVLANPPFNLKNWGGEALQEDVRWKYGMPPTGNANFAWMQHMIWHLNGTGKIWPRIGKRVAFEPDERRGRYSTRYRRGRSGRGHCSHAGAAVLQHPNSRMPVDSE